MLGLATIAAGHCQIPCGIYDDDARFTLMKEHVTTIEKSMKEITRISALDKPDQNQLTRWVMNKEAHANELAEIVTFYFMAQRIKPVTKDDKTAVATYLRHVTLLHEVLVYAMKTKQTTNLAHCAKLRALIKQFQKSYQH
jgi:nickel superoxide dismutase